MRSGKKKYLFATYSLAKEGLVDTDLHNLVGYGFLGDFVGHFSDQSVGRLNHTVRPVWGGVLSGCATRLTLSGKARREPSGT